MEMSDLPPLENTSPLLVLTPVVPSFVPFTMSISQCCVPPKSLLRKVFHPYKDSTGWCHCEPSGWYGNLPCSGRVQRIPHKIRGCDLSNGGSQSGQSCCGTDEEPCDQLGALCSGCTPTYALCLGSPELWTVGASEDSWEGSGAGSGWRRTGLFWDVSSQVDWVVWWPVVQLNHILFICSWVWMKHKDKKHEKDKHEGERWGKESKWSWVKNGQKMEAKIASDDTFHLQPIEKCQLW